MRRFPLIPVLVVLAAIVAAVGGWLLFSKSEHERYVAVSKIRQQRSEVRMAYTVQHTNGPVASETWTFKNIDGRSTASYAALDRHNTKASFDEAVTNYDVTFLFQKLVLDGIWDLESRPFRGSSETLHVVEISQVADKAHGSHRFLFSDAAYIAHAAGREYHIHLDKNKPLPNLLNLQSTSVADPRYQKIVDDFAQFGSPTFKRTMKAARAKLLAGPA
jgi:hypothetical protein